MLALSRILTVCALISLAACSGNDTGWQGGTVMSIHWEHYKETAAICHKLEAESVGKDPGSFESEPVEGCRRVEGEDCYVYTGEDTSGRMFGDLLRNCFETREADIEREKNP
jgi:hypothetical protein